MVVAVTTTSVQPRKVPMVQPQMLATLGPRRLVVAVVAELVQVTTTLLMAPMVHPHVVAADLKPQDRPQTLPKATRRLRRQQVAVVPAVVPVVVPDVVLAVVEAMVMVIIETTRIEMNAVLTVQKSSKTKTLGSTSITTWTVHSTRR